MKSRLRILHVGKYYPPHMGGIETHLETLCMHLQPSADISVLVANDGRSTREEVINGIYITRLARVAEIKSSAFCPGLTAQIRRADVDIVHLHLPNPIGAAAWLLSHQRAKLVVTYHSDIVRQKILGRIVEPIIQAVLSRAEAIIATSPNYLETSSTLQRHRNRCHVIPYGIRPESFERPDPDTVARIRTKYGPRVMLAVGRLVYYKGFEYAIRAMCEVDAKLLLIGDGPLRAHLELLVRQLGLSQRVVLLGEVQNRDIVSYYHAADLFLFPSVERSEAFGIVQLEAMMCGLPVVNTSLDSGVPFVSLDGLTGTTIPPRDPKSLADAMNGLLKDPERRMAYAIAGRKRVEEEFSASVMTRRTLDLYGLVLQPRCQPSRPTLASNGAIFAGS